MLPKTNNKLLIFIVIIPILVLLFFYLNWLWPFQNDVAQLESNVRIEKQRLEQLQTQTSNVESNKNENQTSTDILPIQPATDQLVLILKEAEAKTSSVIDSIEEVDAQDNNVENQEVSPQIERLSYRLNVTAKDYKSLTDFITVLEQSDRLIIVTTSSLDSDTGFNNSSGKVTAEITIETYYNPTK